MFLSTDAGQGVCCVCREPIPEGRRGVIVYCRITDELEDLETALICFRCIDVMGDIVREARGGKRG